MSDSLSRLTAALTGRYRIERELGEGGMAKVYLADDLRHERRVALKVLKPELAAAVGADRFLAEIKTTAKLQHPHILPLFDSGQAQGLVFYAMPYVDGESLQDRLDRERQLEVEEAVRIAVDLAEALDHAHRLGVIHRDIKPANVLLHSSRPLLADFGIALAVGAVGDDRITETGLSVGTPQYMSPEQALGEPYLGPATDTYALGAVLYTMLAGEPPFTGGSPQAILGKVVTGGPPSVRDQRKNVPPNVDAAIRRALEKVPADRFRSVGEFARALSDPGFAYRPDAAPGAPRRAPSKLWTGVVLASVLMAAVAWSVIRRDAPRPVIRFEYPSGFEDESEFFLGAHDVAPDGSWLVGPLGLAGGRSRLWARPLAQLDAAALAGTDSAFVARIAPSGDRVAFVTTALQVRVVPSEGGPYMPIEGVEAGRFLTWLDEEQLAFSSYTAGRIYRASTVTGEAEVVLELEPSSYLNGALNPLPNGRGLLFGRCRDPCAQTGEIWALDFDSGEAHFLMRGVLALYHPPGELLALRSDGVVTATPFHPDALALTGPTLPVFDGVATDGVGASLRVAANGTLLVGLGPSTASGSLLSFEVVEVRRDGSVAPVDEGWIVQPAPSTGSLALSPDGRRLALGLVTSEGEDLWVKGLPDGPLIKLTDNPGVDTRPAWTHDGRIVYRCDLEGRSSDVCVRSGDGSDEARRLLTAPGVPNEIEVSPDGAWAIVRIGGVRDAPSRDLYSFRLLDPNPEGVPLLTGPFDETNPRISPDGRWLAYVADESGQPEVYVRPFPEVSAARIIVSTDGGVSPMWTSGGDELIYLEPFDAEEPPGRRERVAVRAVAVSLERGETLRVLNRQVLFELPFLLPASPERTTWVAASPDGAHLISLRRVANDGIEAQASLYRLAIIVNFREELRRRSS